MKTINNMGAQGDVLFRRIPELPVGAKEVEAKEGKHVVAHSETGHHHYLEVVPGLRRYVSSDPLIGYLSVEGVGAEVVHARPWDTHETMRLTPGIYEVRRQKEYVPGGFRRVED
jgi:hypothetical protein